ncbi:MAG: type II secretion system protein M [Pseudomonadota bacterium]
MPATGDVFLLEPAVKFWQTLSAREKWIIKLGFPLVLALVFYFYYWEPNLRKLENLRLAVPQQRATLAWMEHEINQAGPYLTKPAKEKDSRPILTLIERSATKSGIKNALERVQPGTNGEVKLWFQDANADQWFKMVDFFTSYGISIEAATITRADPGFVTARLTVKQ